MGEIWQQYWVHREGKKRGELPVIHPVVLYHGPRQWTAPLQLTGLHRPRDATTTAMPTRYPAELEYRLVDLWLLKPLRLKARARTLAFLITLRHALRPLTGDNARWLVRTLGTLPVSVKTRVRLLEYLLRSMPETNTDNLVTAVKEAEYTMEGGAAIMTIAQELERRGREKGRDEGREEGVKKGREEGVKKGREETARTVARNLLDRDLSVELIVETTGLTREQVTELQREKT
jgi:hypothetical protein